VGTKDSHEQAWDLRVGCWWDELVGVVVLGNFYVVVKLCFCVVVFVFVLLRQWASSRYRSTSPVRRTDRVFDCGERWVRVDGQVCGLMYVSCYCTAWEDGMMD